MPLLALCGLSLGCADTRDPVDAGSGFPGADGETGEAGDGDGDDDGGVDKFDVADGEGEGADDGGSEEGCEKFDFLFVVDNSDSMMDNQQTLIANFPAFIDSIGAVAEVDDYHVMVIDSDDAGPDSCNQECNDYWNENDPYKFTPCPYHGGQCGADQAEIDAMDACDVTMGSGINHPIGRDASSTQCFDDGQRYLTSDEPGLKEAFACAAQVGTGGDSNEKQMESLISSLQPELVGPGGCNDGFLRDDAVLVIVLLTDEEDGMSKPKDDPQAWYEAVVAAKGGNEEAIVTIGLLSDKGQPNQVCSNQEFSDAQDLRDFVQLFTHHTVGSVCEPDYQPIFKEAVSVIDVACDGFVPPG